MKLIKIAAALITSCAVCAGVSGCQNTENGSRKYELYTNMQEGCFEVLVNDFKPNYIQNDNQVDSEAEPIQKHFTSKEKLFFAMQADASLIIADNFPKSEEEDEDGVLEKFDSLGVDIRNTLDEVEKAISSNVASSDIYKFNNSVGGEKIEISKITYEVLTAAKSVYYLTDGYYNPALYYNVIAYGFGGDKKITTKEDLPSDELLQKYKSLYERFGEVELETEDEKYFVTKPEASIEADGETLYMKLDLGGIGKGYAVDLVEGMLAERGYKYGTFNFGSSSITINTNAYTGKYNLLLTNPRSPFRDAYIRIPVCNVKVSTSGDNEKFYLLDGVRYCHVIDPTTGKPVQTGIMSATVIGDNAAEADALTTAIMAMGCDRAKEFIKTNLSDKKAVFTVNYVN